MFFIVVVDRVVLSRERKVLNFLPVPRWGFDSGVFMRPTACVTVDDDVFTSPGTPWAGIAGSRGRGCVGVPALTLLIYPERGRMSDSLLEVMATARRICPPENRVGPWVFA